jgi:hypothetical protein
VDVWLAADDPEGEREAVDTIERWSQKGFHRQHYSAMLARVQTALYRGDAEAAWRLFTEQQSRLRRSLITRFRIESLYLRVRSALAMAASQALQPIPRRSSPHRQGAEAVVRSDCLAAAGRHCKCRGQYATGPEMTSERCRSIRPRRHDVVRGGGPAPDRHVQDDAPGRELRRQTEEWMAAEIKNPVCMTRMLAPGFPDVR